MGEPREVDGVFTTAEHDRACGIKYDLGWYGERYFTLHDSIRRKRWYYTTAFTLAGNLWPKRAIDLGCGLGNLVEGLRAVGVEAYGADGSDAAIALALPSIRHYISRVNLLSDKLPFEDGSMDLVTCIEVVEHIPEQDHLFREAARVLRPGGAMFLQTPKPGTSEADDPTHIAVKHRAEWKAQAANAGLIDAKDELTTWEHELPMTRLGQNLGWLRTTKLLKKYVMRTGTRSLFRKANL